MSRDELQKLRARIDEVDDQLIPLLEERFVLSKAIGEKKAQIQTGIYVREREDAILLRIIENVADQDLQEVLKGLYREIFKHSRKLQEKDRRKKVGYLGGQGSFSEEAAQRSFTQGEELVAFSTFDLLLDELEEGRLDEAILPIENSTTGGVDEVYDLLVNRLVVITGEAYLPVTHYLIGREGTAVRGLERIYSHPQGFAQCRQFLKTHVQGDLVPVSSTSSAVERVAAEEGKVAAIASPQAAKKHGLTLLEGPIQDQAANRTRFIMVGTELEKEGNQIALVFETPHQPGALARVLALLSDGGLNMNHIASRPNRDQGFGYHFFVEVEGSLADSGVMETLERVKAETKRFKIVGHYVRG